MQQLQNYANHVHVAKKANFGLSPWCSEKPGTWHLAPSNCDTVLAPLQSGLIQETMLH